jgi:hypothetical protein
LDMPPSARGTTVIALAVRKTTSAALMQTKQTLLNRLRPGNSVALRFAWMVLTVLLLPNVPAQARQANGVRLSTETRSRRCLQPVG